MGYSRKYLNNTSSPVSLTITSSSEPTGYLGSVVISAYNAITTENDINELDWLAANQSIEKYLYGNKILFPGPTGYLGTFGYTGSAGPGYTGSRGATGFKGSAA